MTAAESFTHTPGDADGRGGLRARYPRVRIVIGAEETR
ncbi:hypothetical protein M2390_000382 [Mycetocola sp. BIGb0189]|nr:hypothetical protein [Mycetocola sp. BIGb0189]